MMFLRLEKNPGEQLIWRFTLMADDQMVLGVRCRLHVVADPCRCLVRRHGPCVRIGQRA